MIRSFSQIPPPGYTEVAAHRKIQAESRQRPCEFSDYTRQTLKSLQVFSVYSLIISASMIILSY